MKRKIIYISILVILCVGFFYLGWYEHKTVTNNISLNTLPTSTDSTTDFGVREFFSSFSNDQCPFINTPDTQTCLTNLADSTLVKAKILESQLLQPSSENKIVKSFSILMNTEDYNYLHTIILSLQKTRDNYINNYCELVGMLSYAGTGMESDAQSCRYYYAQQYLNTLKALDTPIYLY